MKSKFNFAMDKIKIKGPSLRPAMDKNMIKMPPPYSVKTENKHRPLSLYWWITAEGREPKMGILIGASLDIDATTGQIAYFSGGY